MAWIVKAHGGAVTVESELQEGTRFTVSLPAGTLVDWIVAESSGRARRRAGTLRRHAMAHLEIQRREREGITILDLKGRLAVGGASPNCAKKSTTETRCR